MSEAKSCACAGSSKLIFSCSGAADVGEISDRAARALNKAGVGKMYCLSGLGGGVPSIAQNTRAADKILAIDGCPLNCASKTLEAAGFSNFLKLRLADVGMHKGVAPATDATVTTIIEKAKTLLA